MIGIYKIENKINHKVYIGQSIHINERLNAHKRQAYYSNMYFSEYPLYKAMRKYGIKNFDFSVIEECQTEQLNEKEQYWIAYYKSYGENGYNLTPGGAGYLKAPAEKVIQLFNSGLSIDEIMDIFDCSKNTIIEILHSNNLGYLSQAEKNKLQPNCQSVEQYTLDGNYINTYCSIGAAAQKMIDEKRIKSNSHQAGVSNISNACHNHTTAYNYIWKFTTDSYLINDIVYNIKINKIEQKLAVAQAVLKRCSKKVNQYDLCGKYLRTFPSVVEAGKTFQAPHGPIARVCRGEGKTSHGYIWRYTSEDFPIGKDLTI